MNDLYITTTNEMRYKIIGEGPVVMLLHGWGQNLEAFDNLVQGLEGKFILVDLMGFGMSDEPDYPRNVDDYVKDIEALVDELKIDKFTLLGHSFGGRVAIKYASRNYEKLSHLVLVNSAGIKHHDFSFRFKVIKYKIKKAWYKITSKQKLEKLISSSGSKDYRMASYVMRGTLKRVVKEDLKKAMKQIVVPTTIMAGYYDYVVSMEDNVLMHKLIKNSKLYVFYKSGHFTYIDEKEKCQRLLKRIIRLGDKDGNS